MTASSLNIQPPMLTENLHSTNASNTFLAIPQTDSSNPEMKVGYVGANHSTYQETLEEALYLANLLNTRVSGVIVSSFCRISTKYSLSSSAKALFSIWHSFFSQYPSGQFIQYFFGSGVCLIEEALSLFAPPPQSIVFIGVNSDKRPSFPCHLIESTSNPCQSRQLHDVLLLPTSPDSQGLFHKRFNDKTFSSALVDIFFKVTEVSDHEDLHRVTHLTISSEDAHAFDTTLYSSNDLCKRLPEEPTQELCLRARQVTKALTNLPISSWPQERLKRAVNLALNCLRVSSYLSLLLKPTTPTLGASLIGSETKIASYRNQSLQDRYPNGTFPNGLLFNGTFPENGSYPSCIYPCGITPNGDFTTVTPVINIFEKLKSSIDQSTKNRLDNYKGKYPYYELLLDERAWLIKSGSNIGLYPCNITPLGVLWSGNKKSKLCSDFSYKKFFSGLLVNETSGVYPGNIYPNGTFGDCSPSFSEPYGPFKNNFPYSSFFNGSFPYESRFVANLNKTYLSPPESIEQANFMVESGGSNYFGTSILTSYWLVNSLSQLTLISYNGGNCVGRKLKALALGLASTTFGMSVIDLCYNARKSLTNEEQGVLTSHSLLTAYNGVYLAHEIIAFSSPWIKSKVLQAAAKATRIKGVSLKNNLSQITSAYQKSLQNIRIIVSLLGLLLIGLLAITINSKHRFSENTSFSVESTFLSIFTGSMACMLLLFLCSVNKHN